MNYADRYATAYLKHARRIAASSHTVVQSRTRVTDLQVHNPSDFYNYRAPCVIGPERPLVPREDFSRDFTLSSPILAIDPVVIADERTQSLE